MGGAPFGFGDTPAAELAAWLGNKGTTAPPPPRAALVVKRESGFHVASAGDALVAFRCGTPVERFCQLDQLHVDFWWKEENVLADGGTFQYGGDTPTFRELTGTAGHNTVQIDSLDQMLFLRQFKFIYPLHAELTDAQSTDEGVVLEGFHDGFARVIPGCRHKRRVSLRANGLLEVHDWVDGRGAHVAVVRWRLVGSVRAELENGFSFETTHGQTGTMRFVAPPVGAVVRQRPGVYSRRYGRTEACVWIELEITSELPLHISTQVLMDA